MLSREEKIPYYPDISDPSRYGAIKSFDEILQQEKKLSRALSAGISEQKGFTAKHKIPDIVKELSSDMGVNTPDIRFKYDPRIAGSMDGSKGLLTLNPESLADYGRESVIAHELRHLKEFDPEMPYKSDSSIRRMLYTAPEESIIALERLYGVPEAIKKEQGKSLGYYQKIKDRLFPNDKLKYQIDALDAYNFLERGHFAKPFLKENLERVAKKLPIIGMGATALGVATAPNPANAAVLEGMSNIIPGGVEDLGISNEQKALDTAYLKKLRQISQRKK
jgi:hypothetical protein